MCGMVLLDLIQPNRKKLLSGRSLTEKWHFPILRQFTLIYLYSWKVYAQFKKERDSVFKKKNTNGQTFKQRASKRRWNNRTHEPKEKEEKYIKTCIELKQKLKPHYKKEYYI